MFKINIEFVCIFSTKKYNIYWPIMWIPYMKGAFDIFPILQKPCYESSHLKKRFDCFASFLYNYNKQHRHKSILIYLCYRTIKKPKHLESIQRKIVCGASLLEHCNLRSITKKSKNMRRIRQSARFF